MINDIIAVGVSTGSATNRILPVVKSGLAIAILAYTADSMSHLDHCKTVKMKLTDGVTELTGSSHVAVFDSAGARTAGLSTPNCGITGSNSTTSRGYSRLSDRFPCGEHRSEFQHAGTHA